MTETDVVLVTHNSQAFVPSAARCIASLPDIRSITVIDNGSTDDTVQLAAHLDWGAPFRIEIRPDNPGFGAGINQGAFSLDDPAPYLLVVNPDVTIDIENYVSLVSRLDMNSRLGVVGAVLRESSGSKVSYARRFPTRASILRRRAIDTDHGPSLTQSDWICGALMLWRRSAFEQVQGFSRDYFLYFEDVDICKRASGAGWIVAVDGAAHAIHDQGHGEVTSDYLRAVSRASRRKYARRWLGSSGVGATILADFVELVGTTRRRLLGRTS